MGFVVTGIIVLAAYWYMPGGDEKIEEIISTISPIEEPIEDESDSETLSAFIRDTTEPPKTLDSLPEPPPIPQTEASTPLPMLYESDPVVVASLGPLNSSQQLLPLLTSQDILRKTVRAVYALSKGSLVKDHRPINSPKSQFKVKKVIAKKAPKESSYTIAENNYKRYTPYINILTGSDSKTVAKLYQLYLPLLQQAYEELGSRQSNFHQITIQAIDVLLSTPRVSDEVQLTSSSVAYKFKDKTLESLPPAQKLMVRIGNKNRDKVEAWITEFKNELLKMG